MLIGPCFTVRFNRRDATGVRFIDLSFNQFNGTIPSALGALSRLKTLAMDGNRLNGNIPSALGSIASLVYVQFIRLHCFSSGPYRPNRTIARTSSVVLNRDVL